MKYRNADISVLFNVWVPDVCDDAKLGGPKGVLFGKYQVALEKAALVESISWSDDENLE